MQFPTLAERPERVSPERVFDFDMYAPPQVAQDFHQAWKTLQAADVPDLRRHSRASTMTRIAIPCWSTSDARRSAT
jgi:hypothetical protein